MPKCRDIKSLCQGLQGTRHWLHFYGKARLSLIPVLTTLQHVGAVHIEFPRGGNYSKAICACACKSNSNSISYDAWFCGCPWVADLHFYRDVLLIAIEKHLLQFIHIWWCLPTNSGAS